MLKIYFSNLAITRDEPLNLTIQVRGRSSFQSFGKWSNPETLTIRHVPPPTEISVGTATDVERRVSGQTLLVSAKFRLAWTPPSGLDSFDGYRVVLTRQPVSRFGSPLIPGSSTQVILVSHNNNYNPYMTGLD